MKIGILGVGGIGLASAAWLAQRGHEAWLWAPRGAAREPGAGTLVSTGVLDARAQVTWAPSVAALSAACEVLVVAVPVNGHRTVMDALAPHLRPGQTVIVSSMASLSSLYLFEQARRLGVADLTVASIGTTVLTARREAADRVRIMTRRSQLGVSALPTARQGQVLALCTALFGDGFAVQSNALASALTNINPAAHGPLALFNWTRIERAENWPQYHYMTPGVAAVIEKLDAERLALAAAFGLQVRSIEQHFAQSFGTQAERLADIAAELHAKRGGPPGPTDIHTRFLAEDVPYGLVFCAALGRLASVPTPATDTLIAAASLICGVDHASGNDLLEPLGLARESPAGLLARVNA
ncbi:MAG: NAD/NADP octopine/nopaline dehydrogenase family protein [Ottowia sp.]|jgi:opine dehydrogenase